MIIKASLCAVVEFSFISMSHLMKQLFMIRHLQCLDLRGCWRRCLGPVKANVKRDLAARLHEEDPTLGRGIAHAPSSKSKEQNTRLFRLMKRPSS